MGKILERIIESLRKQKKRGKREKINFSSLKRLFPYLRTRWKQGLTASIFMIIVSLLALPSPYLMKYIIDDVLLAKNIRLLNLIIVLLVVIQLGRLVFSFLTNYLFNIFNQEILVKIKKDLFHRLLRLPISFYDNKQSGYLLSRLGEVERLSFFFSNSMVRVLISFFEFIFCLTILFHLSWKLTLISLLILPLFYFSAKYYSWGIRKFSKELMEKNATLFHQIQDSLSGVGVIKVFTAEERETEKIHSRLDELKETSIKRNIIFTFSSELLSLFGAVGGFVVLWFSGLEIIRGNFTLGSYIAFSAYLAKLYGPTQILTNIGLSFQPAITALVRISELMELTAEEEKEKGIKIRKIKGAIEFKDVYFSYDTRKILIDINFKIKEGEKILITGPNGSGKSTLIKLLLGLYDTQRGKILIDKHERNKISLTSLRERISIVSQNPFLFNDTIKNNILYSRPEAKENEIEKAARLSGAYEFIKRLEKGFETVIGERGVRLSGGERQKISIARAILKNSDFFIFDEATTHLDQESEKRIERFIRRNFENKTCILISHNILKMKEIDRIFILKKGKILDKGKHDELYQRCKYYQELCNNKIDQAKVRFLSEK